MATTSENPTLVQSARGITLLGGGDVSATDLGEALQLAPVLVAADGAAAVALRLGLLPQAVIGDLDSLDPATAAALPPERIHHIAEQVSTDFDKCLRSIAAPLVVGVGFLGERLDHELAALSSLVRHSQPCILLGRIDLCFHAPPELALEPPAGSRFSLFPLAPVEASASGLRWPVGGGPFAPAGRIGTSNEVSGPVQLRMAGPGMLVVMPRQFLAQAAAALCTAPRWARAELGPAC